jgi:hypothetical protein
MNDDKIREILELFFDEAHITSSHIIATGGGWEACVELKILNNPIEILNVINKWKLDLDRAYNQMYQQLASYLQEE